MTEAAADPAQASSDAPAAPDAAPVAPETVGATLTRAREAAGLSIDDCAQQLKFPARKLEALEKERFDELPEGTYARGMLRAYARLLNLDANALVQRASGTIQVQDTSDTAVSLRRPIPFSEAGKRTNVFYAVLSVIALAIVVAVVVDWLTGRGASNKLTFVPAGKGASPTATAPAPEKAAAKPADGSSVTSVTPQITPVPQEPVKPAPVEAAPAPSAATPVAAPTPASAIPAAPPEAGKRRIVMNFERDSWIEVRAGKRLLASGMVEAGSQKTFDGTPPFQLLIGNASTVRLTYDDKPVKLVPHAKSDVAKLTLE